MKIAIVSTPRSGNTWLRYLLATLYGLEQHAVHTPDAVDWSGLSDNCILQLHWHHTESFSRLLQEHGFKVVTIARHPLDVLISILNFAPHEPQTACWLNGEGGDESTIYGQAPGSPEFLAYALSPRSQALLSVTKEWWSASEAIKVRYEELVHSPEKTLESLCLHLGPPIGDIQTAIAALTIEKLRLTSSNNHFWKGQPGLWASMIPLESAHQIEALHSEVFETLGYACNSDPLQSPPVRQINLPA